MKQLLRAIDRLRFEGPLALVLAAAACFAIVAMPERSFAGLPLAGHLGHAGQTILGALAALIAGGIAYAAMRPRVARPAAIRVKPAPAEREMAEEDAAPVRTERLRRVRRADAHPDAPPREPIRASRDLGEPFMGVYHDVPEIFGQETAAIPDGDFSEVAQPETAPETEKAAPEPIVADVAEPVPAVEPDRDTVAEWAVHDAPSGVPSSAEALAAPVDEPVAIPQESAPATPPPPAMAAPVAQPFRTGRESLDAMMDRLSAGLERRAGEPPLVPPPTAAADPRVALRAALDELNRLSTQRH